MSRIVAFYRHEAPDYLGRTLREIWQWDHDWLEDMHNYIQVLFPNRERSGVTPRAPVLDDEAVTAFRQDAELRANLARSHDLMLDFYGLKYLPEVGEVVLADKVIAGGFPGMQDVEPEDIMMKYKNE